MESIGIDVHKVNSQICLVGENAEVLEERRIQTDRERFAAVLGKRPKARVLIEASTESEWAARYLEELGHEVIVADPNFAPMYRLRRNRYGSKLSRLNRADFPRLKRGPVPPHRKQDPCEPASLRARATVATRFPRRTSIRCAHIRRPADSAVLDRRTAHAASTSSHRARAFPLLVIPPRCCFPPSSSPAAPALDSTPPDARLENGRPRPAWLGTLPPSQHPPREPCRDDLPLHPPSPAWRSGRPQRGSLR
jgi:hypothetical protein